MGVIGDWLREKALPWIGNQASSLINRYTGAALTGAEREANEFSVGQAQISREWDEKMYNQYNSPSALVSQYQSAGINPALMFGGSTPAAPQQSSSPTSASPAGSLDLLGSLMQLAGLKANIENTRSETALRESQTALNNIDLGYRALEKEFGLEESRSRIASAFVSMQKQLSDISVNNSEIEVNGERIKLISSQVKGIDAETQLAIQKTALASLDVEKAKVLLPFAEEVQRAEIALTYAQTTSARSSAENQLYQGNLAFINAMREADLIDSGYYELLTKQASRDYKWTPVNNIVNNVSKVVTAAGSVMIGTGALGRIAGSASSGVNLWTPRGSAVQTDFGRVNYGR